MKRIQIIVSMMTMIFATAMSLADDYAAYSTIDVSDSYRTFITNNVKFSVSTEKVESYPLAVLPMFWVDCSHTNGWTIGGDMAVSKVVSRSSSERYLTSDHSEICAANYPGNIWYGYLNHMRSPILTSSSSELTGAYLDFGDTPTGTANGFRVLFFNPVDGRNLLPNVGTIVGVYKSYTGGGNVIGGKYFSRRTGYTAKTRGTSAFEAVVAAKSATAKVNSGDFWQGHQKSSPAASRWSCGWEVIALNPTELVESDGICGNPYDQDEWTSGGGQGIAELMIFGERLSDANVEALIAYLEKKWFGKSSRGQNGNAQMSWLEVGGFSSGEGLLYNSPGVLPVAGVDVPIDAASGEMLTVGRLTGGRASPARGHKIVKTGAGILRINDAANFGGTVEVQEGCLELGGKTVPTFAELPSRMHLRIDPATTSSMTLVDGLISSIVNLGDTSWGITAAAQTTAASRPELISNFPSAGLGMMDFKTTLAADRRYLELNANIYLQTIVLVIDSSTYTGMSFMNRFFQSRAGQPYQYDNWYDMSRSGFFTTTLQYVSDNTRDLQPYQLGHAWVNGRKVNKGSEAYETPGLNVVALRVPAGPAKVIGGYASDHCGGIRIGEMLGWSYPLTEEQILDVQAYLMKKWLGRAAPGYRLSDSEQVPDVQAVVAENGVTVDVPEGQVATIGTLTVEGAAVKTGAGTLRICNGENVGGLVVREGGVEHVDGPDVSTNCELAKGPSLHFDPSDAHLVRTSLLNGTNYVWTLLDPAGRVSGHEPFYTWSPDCHRFPFMDGSECNGLPTVNFGEQLAGYHRNKGKRLRLSRRMLNTRAVYFILGSQSGGGNPLGYSSDSTVLGAKDWTRLDFFRDWGDDLSNSPLWRNSAEAVRSGELYIDGVRKENVDDYIPNGGYELVELHTTAGCEFDALGCGSANYIFGGMKLGEIVVYERPLTEREKVATRNYLLKKWFGKADGELVPLPAKPAVQPLACTVGKVIVDADAAVVQMRGMSVVFPDDVEVEIRNLPIDGTPVEVLSAESALGVRNLKTAATTWPGIPLGKYVMFDFIEGVLSARLLPIPGFILSVY